MNGLSPARIRIALTAALAVVFLLAPITLPAQIAAYYEENCSTCHTIGGGVLAGPDLKDVTKRAERKWLIEFMRDPEAKVKAKDAYALHMLKQADGMMMPAFPDITAEKGEELLQYIDEQSKADHASALPAAAEEPFTAEEAEAGRAYFDGSRHLAAGGVACIACHHAAGLASTGGRLAPDLTLVVNRLGGRRGLTAWLGSPATPVMAASYRKNRLTPEEIRALVAFFEQARVRAAIESRPETLGRVHVFALIGAVLFAAVAGVAGRNRLRGVRRSLVPLPR